MNKYQDIHYRHLNTQSFSSLPMIKVAPNPSLSLQHDLNKLQPISMKHGSLLKLNTPRSYAPEELKPPAEGKHKTCSISEFSVKQNELIGGFFNSSISEQNKPKAFPDINSKYSMPGAREFSRLIENFNEIISPRSNLRAPHITEAESMLIEVPEGRLKYYKVLVKGKKSPLAVRIKRNKGKVCIYTSTVFSEPGPLNYDKYYATDYFEIRDSSSIFKNDVIYFGVKGAEDSEVKISISFGKNIASLQELKRMKQQLSNSISIADLSFESESHSPIKEIRSSKDFINENKAKAMNSSIKCTEIVARAESWKTKHKRILEKKKYLLEMKKSRALESLNKKTLKKELEQYRQQELQIKNLKNQHSSRWLKLIYFLKSISHISTLVASEKQKRLRRISLNLNAIKIQKLYRSSSNNLTQGESVLTRSIDNLLFYKNSMGNLLKLYTCGKQIVSCISSTAHSRIVFHSFAGYYRGVVRIQRNVRKFLVTKEARMRELVKLWNTHCELFLFRRGSRKLIRKKESIKIISIPANIRDKALEDYYLVCSSRFREKVRNYLNLIKNLSENKLFKTVVSSICPSSLPTFEYIPSEKELEEMVRRVIT